MPEPAADPGITVTRVLDAPRELVWKAWTEPEQLARWWGKRGWSTPPSSITMDVRPGGAFRLTSVNDEDGSELPLDGVFREVAAPERLVFAEAGAPDEAVTVVTFADLGDGRTELVLRTTVRMAEATRRAAERGLRSALDRLAELLA